TASDTHTATVYRDCIARLEQGLKTYEESAEAATIAPREELVRQVTDTRFGPSGGRMESALAATITTNDDSVEWLQFFQANDGQHIYLHPLDWRVLQHEYKTVHPGSFPQELSVTIEDRQETTMTENLRQRCPHLSHLPLGCDLVFIEVDLQRLVSTECYQEFANALARREKQRVKRRDQERAEQLAAQHQHNRQLRKHMREAATMASNHRRALASPRVLPFANAAAQYAGGFDEWATPDDVRLDTASFPTIEKANEREAADARASDASTTGAFLMDDEWLSVLAESDVAEDHLKPAMQADDLSKGTNAPALEPLALSFAAAAQQRQAQQNELNRPPSWDASDFPTIGDKVPSASGQQSSQPARQTLVPRLLTHRNLSSQSTSPLHRPYDDATLFEALERHRMQATNHSTGRDSGGGDPSLSVPTPSHDADDDYQSHLIGTCSSPSHQDIDDHTSYDDGYFFYEDDDDYADDIEAHGFDFRVNAGPIQRASSSHSRKSGAGDMGASATGHSSRTPVRGPGLRGGSRSGDSSGGRQSNTFLGKSSANTPSRKDPKTKTKAKGQRAKRQLLFTNGSTRRP
ncbi:hypothetical protein H4R34_004387, partial [Dimargaris verticillata]